ncbi:MAG: IPT/TIG domain-containing protein [Acidimicrobiales bacterium]|jgi:sugar lactone lactonase YvrE
MGKSGVAGVRVHRRMVSRVLLAAFVAGSSFIVPLVATTPAAAEDLVPVVTGVPNVIGVAVDSNGDIFTSTDTGQVSVYPAASGTIFGAAVTQGTLTTLATLGNVAGLAFDSAGNLYMSDYNNGTVSVLSSTGGTVFGQSVTADTVTTLVSGLSQPAGLAFDPAGNLYIDSESGMSVLPTSSGTIFNTMVTADVLTGLTGASGSAPSKSQFVAFDNAGNLYMTDHDAGTVTVLPQASGTAFGQTITADTYQTLVTGLSSPQGLAFDSAGDLFIATDENVSVLPAVSGTLYGSPVTADVVSPLQMNVNLYTVAFDPSGDLLLASPYDGAVLMATTQTASVTAVQFSGSVFNPEVEITGTGFGNAPPTSSPNCANTGRNYDYGNLSFQDDTAADQWQAGFDLDCVGLIVSSWTDTAIDFTLGNYYFNHEVAAGDLLADGDQYSLVVAGDFVSGTVSYRPSVTALGPTTGPSTGGTSVTITGTNFIGATGVDFGADPANSFAVDSSTQITAIDPSGSVGTAAVTVTAPGGTSVPAAADRFTYTPAVQVTYTCTLPAPLGATGVPVTLSEVPGAPVGIGQGGTFPTALAAQVTMPASVVNQEIATNKTQFTIDAQSVTVDGKTSSGGVSGAVDPNTESASATNLPQTDNDLVSNTPYTFDTTYNPVSWKTGPGTGRVDFVPGNIVIVTSSVTSRGTAILQINCTAPVNAAAIASTTVDPATTSPSFQVPPTTPPLQDQVSAGTNGGWAATVSNTSKATVTKVTAAVHVSDGGPALSFNLAGMAAAGTTCSSSGSGSLSCSMANLAPGASATLDVLVNTTKLVTGTSITGSATITSSNASRRISALGAIEVVVVDDGNGVDAVAAPGSAVVSTHALSSASGASISLTLPNEKISVSGKGTTGPAAARATLVSPPPVGVTLESLAPSAEPALCPTTGSPACEGDIVQAVGNFSAYTNKADPVVAVVQFFYGQTIPAGSVSMLKPDGKTVDKLSSCKKTAAGYDTPCLFGKELTGGSKAHDTLYAQDTVYFSGTDPDLARR